MDQRTVAANERIELSPALHERCVRVRAKGMRLRQLLGHRRHCFGGEPLRVNEAYLAVESGVYVGRWVM